MSYLPRFSAESELAGRQQASGPDEQVVREAGEHQPYAVVLKIWVRHVAQADVFVVADLVFDCWC
jgi:hypothetical protein